MIEPSHETTDLEPGLRASLYLAATRRLAQSGAIQVVAPDPWELPAVVGFPFRSVIAAPVDASDALSRVAAGGPGSAMKPAFLTWLADQLGLVAGLVEIALGREPDLEPGDLELYELDAADSAVLSTRVQFAMNHRTVVRVFSDRANRGIVTCGRGLAGRFEVGLEVFPPYRGKGLGADFALAASRLAPAGEIAWAQVPPANTLSLRAFLRAGYRPIASECVFAPDRETTDNGSGCISRSPGRPGA